MASFSSWVASELREHYWLLLVPQPETLSNLDLNIRECFLQLNEAIQYLLGPHQNAWFVQVEVSATALITTHYYIERDCGAATALPLMHAR